jgi:LPXTG-site transpeptidase (sortase) family protein
MTKREAIHFIVIRSIGNFLVLFALYGVIATFGSVLMQEIRFRIVAASGVRYEVQKRAEVQKEKSIEKQTQTRGFTDVLAGSIEQVLVPEDTRFGLVIPKIGANAKVFPNVDPGNSVEFLSVLQKGVAHAKGSVFPGISGTTYLFAHSTDNWWHVGRYNAVFYLLKELQAGDEISIFFEDVRYDYVVTEKVITSAEDLSYLFPSKQEGKQRLVLQTCWPPGTTWKRLLIVANLRSTN